MIIRINFTISIDGKSARRSAGLIVAALIHLLVLWMLLAPRPIPPKKQKAVQTEGEIVWMKPVSPPQAKPQPRKAPPPPNTAKLHPKAVREQPRVAQAPPPPNLPPPPITVPKPPPPEEDMMARVEAKRNQRAEAKARNTPAEAAQEESESARGVRLAQANIANLQSRANAAREQHGGLFKLGTINNHHGEFTFNGWNKSFKRNWARVIQVELGDEPDIETAIIKSMIVQIRMERTAEFTWESHRLGRLVELNARPEYDAELRVFLMKEFFPNYRTLARQ
jgi:outer membrane biosynthesis protein TonB